MTRFGFLLLLVLAFACSSNNGPADDGGTDARGDDAAFDAASDAESETDAGADAESDAETDAETDGGSDAATDDACVPPPCPAPPEGCDYVGSDPCVCGELVCDGTECTTDDDCPGGFCRATMVDDVRACHPWAGEGESCGGFLVPWTLERCDPDVHTCMEASPFIADAPGTCLLEVTVAELADNPDSYRDRVVGVRTSYVTNGVSACTRLGCPEEMPCCNTCNAAMYAYDVMDGPSSVQLFDDAGVAYECTGTECVMTETCTVMPDQSYRIIGVFDGTGLRVTSIQRISF